MTPTESADLWPGQPALQQAIADRLPGVALEVVAELDSTNAELMRRARAGRVDPVLLLAGVQTAGRGRLGRIWHGEPGASLTFSLGLALAPGDWSGLSLAVGLSLAHSLHPDIRLKWPNDLYWAGQKLGGILVETATMGHVSSPQAPARYVVVGVGLNLQTPSGRALATPAVGLSHLLPECHGPAVLQRVAPALVQALLDFERQGFAPLQALFAQRDALAGQAVRLSDGTDGQALGVDARGALRVQTVSGVRSIDTLEVSVRPAQHHAAGQAV